MSAGMQKQQILIVAGALAIVAGIYFGVPTVNPKRVTTTAKTGADSSEFNIETYENQIVAQLSEARQAYISSIKADVKRGDVADQSHTLAHKLSAFWQDSVQDPLLHYNYLAQSAELDNSEKSLTFAAHSILGYLPFERNHAYQHWLADKGKELFDKALKINANNDSSIVGMGGCIMYGADGNPMEGIMKVREVTTRDSTNYFAQYMLGIGGMISGQYDKAAERFDKVAKGEPGNMLAFFKLAEALELSGDKEKAAQCYEQINAKVDNPEMKMELQKRIQALRSK
jgi:tetratricopeptide (TPR) repeat protein